MPLYPDLPAMSSYAAPDLAPTPDPGLSDTFGAAFRMENDMVNAVEALTAPKFERDETFNLKEALKASPYWEFRDNFLGVKSSQEFNYVASQIEQEQRDRDILMRSGWSGTVAAMTAGLVSPTIFLPFVGEARGVAAIGRALMWGAAGAFAQELPLIANQQTRTGSEIAFSLSASTALAGLLGGAVAFMRPAERAAFDMAFGSGQIAIPTPKPAGAQSALAPDAGTLATGANIAARALDTNFITRSPVTDTITGISAQARWTMAQLSDAGLAMEKNAMGIPTTPGGTAENRINMFWGRYANAAEDFDRIYAEYVYDGNVPGIATRLRSGIAGYFDPAKLSRADFRKEVSRAMWDDGVHQIPAVAAAAKAYREKLYDPILKDAQDVGIIPQELKEIADVAYLNRIFDHEAIRADVNGFVDFLADKFNLKYQEQFSTELERFQLREARTTELVEDLKRSPEEIQDLRDKFGREIADIEDFMEKEHMTALEDSISMLRSAAKNVDASTLAGKQQRKQFLKDARDMEQSSPLYVSYKQRRAELKRRLSNLNKARVAVEKKLANKIEKIERAEELSLNTLRRSTLAARRILDKIDSYSDEALDAKLEELGQQFARAAEQVEKAEARVNKLVADEEIKPLDRTEPTGFKVDNPGGDWVAGKQQRAEEDIIKGGKGTAGATTATAGLGNEELFLPVSALKKLKGVMDEAPRPGMPKYDALEKSIAERGYTNENPIMVRVNHKGEAFIHEGNNRVALADKTGVEKVKVWVQWQNGGEAVDGAWAPKRVAEMEGPIPSEHVLAAEVRFQSSFDSMRRIQERLLDAEDLGRNAVRALLNDMVNETLSRAQRIVEKRAVRTARLQKSLDDLSPEAFNARLKDITDAQLERQMKFAERIRVRGGEDEDLFGGKVDFSAQAREDAQLVKDKILGTYLRMPVVEVMQGERGAQLARLLDIPSREMERWLETDIDKLAKIYTRTMGPDIEIARKLGTVNAEEQLGRNGTIAREMNAQLEAVKTAVDSKGNPRSEKWKQKEVLRIQDEYKRYRDNLAGTIGRLRGTYGLPPDFDGMAYRMSQVVMNLNVLRYMGGVTISSLPDVARPVMRYGLMRTFRDGFMPLVTNLKALKMSAREARLAGVGIEALTAQRANNLFEILDDLGRGSKFERGVEFLSGKQGIVALFSYWTDAMKSITSAIANAKVMDSVMTVVEGGSKSDVAAATRFLAEVGMDAGMAERIAKQVRENAGGGKVEGVWLPQTERWTDDEALRAYRAALAREVNNTIITPGVERPLWTNASTGGRMLSQFKSFAFSSTYKTMLAGLQQRDANFLVGTMISLAMGTLSYYLYSVARGGDAYERMQNAGPDEWADQAIQRSGVLGVLGLAQDITSRIPATAKISSFSGGRSTRRGGDDLVEAVLGPSFDFAKTSSDVITGLDDPTASTVHKMRTLLPWQNVSYLAWLFDSAEKAIDAKERRQ